MSLESCLEIIAEILLQELIHKSYVMIMRRLTGDHDPTSLSVGVGVGFALMNGTDVGIDMNVGRYGGITAVGT